MAIALERIGKRVYFTGDTYNCKGDIKKLGGHWDGGTTVATECISGRIPDALDRGAGLQSHCADGERCRVTG